jgi:hypothetical protein
MLAQLPDALLQATRTVEDHAARAERTATLAEREVEFLKALNVRSPFTLYLSRVSFPFGTSIHLSRIGEPRKPKNLAGSWLHRPGKRAAYHIKDLEGWVSEYKAHIGALETEVQEICCKARAYLGLVCNHCARV